MRSSTSSDRLARVYSGFLILRLCVYQVFSPLNALALPEERLGETCGILAYKIAYSPIARQNRLQSEGYITIMAAPLKILVIIM